MMTNLLTSLVLLSGALFMLFAAIGALRMPDLPMRMHATTKAGALGSGLIMLAVAIFYGSASVTARSFAIVLFIMLTAPVAAHVLARAGYFVGVPLWKKIVKDELKGRYHRESHRLASSEEDKKEHQKKQL